MTLPFLTPITTPDLRAVGIPDPWSYGIADKVRFGELDALNHVNNAAYLTWFESFRLPYLKARQITDYGPTAPRLVLRPVAVQYLAEMTNGMSYVVVGRVKSYRSTSFTVENAVFALGETATQTTQAETVVVLLNRDGAGRYPIPEAGIAAFRREDGAVFEG